MRLSLSGVFAAPARTTSTHRNSVENGYSANDRAQPDDETSRQGRPAVEQPLASPPNGIPRQSVPDGSVAISIQSLSAWYGRHLAIRDVTMDIAPRKVTAIIGPSGCGKSTLIRTINRMHEVAPGAGVSGRLYIGETDIYAPDVDPVAVRRRVGMVFQKPNPFPTMSVFDNVAAGLVLTNRIKRWDLEERVERSLRRAALWDEVKDKLRQPGTALSGGQQQRLCIARALAVMPEILLLDEPASALDPVATLRIEDLIRELSPEVTIVIVTHNMQQAARVSDFTAFMLAGEERVGQLIEYGETKRLFTNPTDSRTEAYITGRFG